MTTLDDELQPLLAVAAALLDDSGVLLEANDGFLRLLPSNCAASRTGSPAAQFFLQPAFAELARLAAPGACDGSGYHGLVTVGDPAGETRTLRGRVWRSAAGLRVLVEFDIVELERINSAFLALNQESAHAQGNLSRANIVLKRRADESSEAALTDVLTGVGNRRRLEQSLVTEVARTRRTGDVLCVIMADIDHFKRVNDEYGHTAGDQVLARFGALLKGRTRPTDIVARYGGEEFFVLMPHTDMAQALAKAETLRSTLELESIPPLTRPVTSSFGVAQWSPDEDGASLLRRVDAALYAAKAGGRNQVVAARAAGTAATSPGGNDPASLTERLP